MEIVKTINLKKYYKMDNYTVKAVDNINLNINNHEFIAIVGSSGSGKSTLLNLLGELDKPTSGKVFINNIDITSMDEDELAIFRRRNIGFIFQNYNLIGNLTVLENITLPIELDGNEIPYDFINEILHVLKLEDKKNIYPNKLSGGQQQRVAIARALATRPSIILADEPTGNLDSKTTQEVIGLIKRTSHLFKQTIVMITHNEDIAQLADRIIKIEDGNVSDIDVYKTKVLTIMEGCPIFKDKTLREHFDCATPKELINKLLLKGEVEDLVNAINNLSDLKKIEKVDEEIKN